MTEQAQQLHSRWDVTVHSPVQTERLAALLGGIVEPGAVIVLDGDLGAGKTTFVRGLARGMGLSEAIVSSPTFTLIHEYDGDVPLYHFDAYRLNDPLEFVELGADEYLSGRGVCAIEWGGNVRSELPPARLELQLTATAPEETLPAEQVGRAGQPKTYGCGGADHWQMTETDIEPSTRRIAWEAHGTGPVRWLDALKRAWEGARGQPSGPSAAGSSAAELSAADLSAVDSSAADLSAVDSSAADSSAAKSAGSEQKERSDG